jgi:hypothetical protein
MATALPERIHKVKTHGSPMAGENKPAKPATKFPPAGVPKTKSRVRKY